MHIKSTVLLIGAGRLAQHLKHWNSRLSNPNELLQWNRSESPDHLKLALTKASVVWLCISDSSIESFFEQHLKSQNLKVVHFSGALNLKQIACAHPLMSFTNSLLPDEVYPQIHFAVSGAENLQSLLPGFKNNFSVLNPENKSYYHALCVLAGNFPQLLWNEAFPEMQKLTLPAEAMELYIRQITTNFIALKEKALTGPLVRKDALSIEKNISSLSRSEKLKNIYVAFAREFGS